MDNNDKLFWPSYVDLLTSLFFIILVLFAISYNLFSEEKKKADRELIEKNFKDEINKSLERLMSDTNFFIYEPNYKRYRLAVNIQFKKNKFEIDEACVVEYNSIRPSLIETGNKLKSIFLELEQKRIEEKSNISLSYLLIIAGRSSNFPGEDKTFNYELSYKRALSLYNFWNYNIDFDFDDKNLRDLIDLQISGNGVGGNGRYNSYDSEGNFLEELEVKNQSFLIQVIPKFSQLKKL